MDQHEIEFAQEKDIVDIHRFLCVISQPVIFCPIDPVKSINEIGRIVTSAGRGGLDFAINARINGEIVASIGVVNPDWWYGKGHFFTDRWFFCYPVLHHKAIGMALLAEAAATIAPTELPLIINGKLKRKNTAVGSGVYFLQHALIVPEDKPPGH